MDAKTPPPLESYSKVTDPDKFRGIPVHAERVVSKLASEFDVVVEETSVPAMSIDRESVVRSVLLTPNSSDAAPIHISFTSFPGIRVKFGRGTSATFPACGCDACGETAEGEIERFDFMVDNVVSGRFVESIAGLFRKRFETETWSDRGSQSRSEVLRKDDPRRQWPRQRFSWKPWPRTQSGDAS